MRHAEVNNGTGIVWVYLELKNLGDMGNPLLLKVDLDSMSFRVTDADGGDVPTMFGPFSGRIFGSADLTLPHDSFIRFRIGPNGHGIPADRAALVDLGPEYGWALPHDGKAYHLHAVLEIAEDRDDNDEWGVRWHGRLELPPVRIPTEPDPVDPATLGPLIEKWGAQAVRDEGRASADAVRRLSLIDDPRVIPWYVKLVKNDRSSLRAEALDRLSRFEGDEALEGLKIGMATRGEDVLAHCTTPKVARQSAEGVRHYAAIALARSPHPRAEALLLSMHDDRSYAVRITVVQAAAQMETPESLDVLARHTDDADASVASEAVRVLKLREAGPEE